MKIRILLLSTLIAPFCVQSAYSQCIPEKFLNDSHDIQSLDKWGPYSKQYAGISHIDDMKSGKRVDFSVIPGMYRRNYSVPNVLYESSYHPWKVSADMKSITYRYDLEWKDRLFVDVTYDILDSNRVSVSAHCVNNTGVCQSILLHNTVSLHYDNNSPAVRLVGAEEASCILYGCDYQSFEPAVKAHDYNLVYDGWFRGEERTPQSTSGSVLGKFGKNKGDGVVYSFDVDEAIENAVLAVRCRVGKGRTSELSLSGLVSELCRVEGSGDYQFLYLGCGRVPAGENELKITALNAENIKFDVLVLADADIAGNLKTAPIPYRYKPEVSGQGNGFIVRYPGVSNCYAVAWDYPHGEVKQYENSSLDVFMKTTVHQHPPRYFTGDRNGHYTSAYLRPVILAPNSDTTIVNLIATGDEKFLKEAVSLYHREGLKQEVKGTAITAEKDRYLPQAQDYALGKQLLEATLLTNVVYPVYTQKEYIRHFTPGKNWNSLYTWDLGCIALAFCETEPVKAFEIIKAYTTEEGAQSAFIHHGTPLPIQFFAFSELYNRCGDDPALEWLYPRLKQYYDYMTGKDATSTTMMDSGLIRTWDYFYNSGGWDDYPPQHELRSDSKMYARVTPVVSSAYYLRAAKTMRTFAEKTGNRKDAAVFEKDIESLSEAIQSHTWDAGAGYYSYVVHDENGQPESFYTYKDGTNFNKGLDGVSPLVGGCCEKYQADILIDNLFDPARLWTPYGFSTVDRSAPYYDMSGYWNGSVWFPHQYFLWKSLLDNNRPDLAEKLAFAVLDTWEKECRETHNCWEHFTIATGRGAGWHNFSGLSSQVINFHNSYFKIGHIATGFDTAVDSYVFAEDYSSLEALLSFEKSSVGKMKSIIVCLDPEKEYKVSFNGRQIICSSPYNGLLYITLEGNRAGGKLKIASVDK